MPVSRTNVSTVEVAISASSITASHSIETLITKLNKLAGVIDHTVKIAGGLANIGRVDTSNVSNVLNAAKELGRAFKELEHKKPDIVVRSENLEKANRRLDALFDKMKGATNIDIGTNKDQVIKNLALWEQGLENARQKFIELGEQGGKVLDGKAFRSEMEAIVNYQNVIEKATEALADWDGYLDSIAKHDPQDIEPDLSGIKSQTFGDVAAEVDREAEALDGATESGSRFGNVMQNIVKPAIQGISKAAQVLWSVLKKLPSAFATVARAAKSFASALAHPISTLKNIFGMGNRGGGGILGGLLRGRSLGQFVWLIVLRRLVMAALRAIVNGIKEGFENIRNYSSEINSEINSIRNSLLYVKNAWAAAFAPIVSVVRPYINYLLDAIAAALNALGRLVAILTGKGFAVQANKLSDAMFEAGEAGKAAAGGTSAANKAAEEYKKTLMGFDQLHVLNAQDSGGSGGGSGGGGGGASGGIDVNEMFTTVSLAGAFKDAIDAEDWEELGRLMAEKVNAAFGKLYDLVNWDNVGEKITKSVNAITTTLNSLVDNVDWDLIGRTFGAGINTLVNTWNLFFDGFDFVNLGVKIATSVNGLFDEINWTELGRAVTQKFKALWETIYGFVTTLKWGEIGTKIGEFINGALDNINLGTVGASIAETLNGISDALNNFTNTVNWDDFSDEIADFFTNFFTKFRAQDFISSISTFVGKLIKGITLALSNNDVGDALNEFGKQIGEKLADLSWINYLSGLAVAIVDALRELLQGLLEGLVEGLLINMGVSPERAHSAFEYREEFETAYQTGDTSYLPGGDQDPTNNSFFTFWNKVQDVMGQYNEWLKQHPEFTGTLANDIGEVGMGALGKLLELMFPSGNEHGGTGGTFEVPVTGVLTSARDEIPTPAKVSSGWTGKLGSAVDGLTKEQKETGGWTAQFRYATRNWWSYQDKDWTVGGWTALFKYASKKWWSYKDSDWTVGGWWAQFKYKSTSWWSSKKSDWSTGGWTAIFQYVIDALTDKQKTLGVTAKITNVTGGIGGAIGNANGGIYSGGVWKPITRYASGGSPLNAELFMAREAGPELVGRIGSSTAVMNNNQIVSSVADGVKRAVIEAMAVTNSGSGGGMPYEINITVKTQNDEVLARAVERGNAKRKYRLGTAIA